MMILKKRYLEHKEQYDKGRSVVDETVGGNDQQGKSGANL